MKSNAWIYNEDRSIWFEDAASDEMVSIVGGDIRTFVKGKLDNGKIHLEPSIPCPQDFEW